MRHRFSDQLEASVRQEFFGIDIATAAAIVGTVASVAIGGVSLISGQQAAAQAQSNAIAVAQYNAQIQEQNAQVALQLSTYQAQQNAAIATQQNTLIQSQINAQQQATRMNAMLSRQQQQVAQSTAAFEATQSGFEAIQAGMAGTQAGIQAQQSRMQADISRGNAMAAELNASFAKQQAAAAQQRHDAGLENAKQLDIYAQQVQAQQREEARRLREDAETRSAQIRAKYAGSGVTFEGSPLVVLADNARLSEAIVQDAAFVSELEARKQQRAADLARFESGFSLIDKQGFMTQAAGYEIQSTGFGIEAAGYELEAGAFDIQAESFKTAKIGHELAGAFNLYKGQANVFSLQIEEANQRTQFRSLEFEGLINAQKYETQLAAANYDTLIAAERYKIGLAEADLTRFGGAVQASSIKADAQASLISGVGNIASSAIGGISQVAKLTAPKPSSEGLIH